MIGIGLRRFASLFALLTLVFGLAWPASVSADEVRVLRFKQGASSAVVSDAVVRGSRHIYSFSARGGQTASIATKSTENNAAFSMWLPGAKQKPGDEFEIEGTTVKGAGEEDDASHWRGRLPQSGTYLIVVAPTRGNATYELRLEITGTAAPASAASGAASGKN